MKGTFKQRFRQEQGLRESRLSLLCFQASKASPPAHSLRTWYLHTWLLPGLHGTWSLVFRAEALKIQAFLAISVGLRSHIYTCVHTQHSRGVGARISLLLHVRWPQGILIWAPVSDHSITESAFIPCSPQRPIQPFSGLLSLPLLPTCSFVAVCP